MNLLVIACLAAGAISFQPQAMPGLHAGPVVSLTDQPAVNYRQADVDGDGLADLVFDSALWVQQAGLFPAERRQPLPQAADAQVDVDHGRVYCIKAGRLAVLQWKDGALAVALDQKLDWPPAKNGPIAGLGRFLHDLDGDGQPELIAVDEHGVTLFALREQRYVKAGQLSGILPELRYLQLPQQPVWPKSRRALSFPARQMACDLLVDSSSLSVVFRDPVPGGQFEFQRETRTLSAKEDGTYQVDAPVPVRSAPVPEHLRPCRLNGDNVLDLAGCRRVDSTGRTVPVSMVETWASLDGGRTFAVRRAAAMDRFLPQTPFVDMDGDGLADMVTESTSLFDGGTREVVERFMTRATVGHTVRVYPQQPGGFSQTPAVAFEVEIALEAAPWRMPPMYGRYQTGELVNVCGDFDGDGRHDLAVRDQAGRVAVRLARGWTFSPTPDAVVGIDPAADYAVADVNGDGRSDIIESLEPPPAADRPGRKVTVHFAASGKGAAP